MAIIKCKKCGKKINLDRDNNHSEKFVQCDNPFCCELNYNTYYENVSQ